MPIVFANFFNLAQVIFPFIVAIVILVFIHEFGHFYAARKNGVHVSVFSIGFGPELFGWTDSKGTRWRISPIPLGGYVKFIGDGDASSSTVDENAIAAMTEEEKNTTLQSKTPLQRIIVAVAGPAANYIAAILALALLLVFKGQPEYEARIQMVDETKTAYKAGIRKDDVLLGVNGVEYASTKELMQAIAKNTGKDVTLKIARLKSVPLKIPNTDADNNTPQIMDVTVPMYTIQNGEKVKSLLGVGFGSNIKSYKKNESVLSAFFEATHFCIDLSYQMLRGIGRLIVHGEGELGGVGSIGAMAKDSMEAGAVTFLLFLITLSVNLGLVNLLPIPVLDGGTIMMTAIEALRGKPLTPKIQERIYKVGFAVIASLMIYTIGADLARFKVFSWVMGLFS